MPGELVAVQVASNGHELALLIWIGRLDQVRRVLLPFFLELLVHIVALGRCQHIRLMSGSRLLGGCERILLDLFDFLSGGLLAYHSFCVGPSLLGGLTSIFAKEIHVFSLIQELGLISLYHGHIFDGFLRNVRSGDDVFAEERIFVLHRVWLITAFIPQPREKLSR